MRRAESSRWHVRWKCSPPYIHLRAVLGRDLSADGLVLDGEVAARQLLLLQRRPHS